MPGRISQLRLNQRLYAFLESIRLKAVVPYDLVKVLVTCQRRFPGLGLRNGLKIEQKSL
jgi:hypothetical protein